MHSESRAGHVLRSLRRHFLDRQMGLLNDDSPCDRVRSSRLHGFGHENRDHAAAKTGPCIPSATVRHRISGTEILTEQTMQFIYLADVMCDDGDSSLRSSDGSDS